MDCLNGWEGTGCCEGKVGAKQGKLGKVGPENVIFVVIHSEMAEVPVPYYYQKCIPNAAAMAEIVYRHDRRWLRGQIKAQTPDLLPADREDLEMDVYERILRYWTPEVHTNAPERNMRPWLAEVVRSAVRAWFKTRCPEIPELEYEDADGNTVKVYAEEVPSGDMTEHGTYGPRKARDNAPKRLPHEDEQHR